MSTRVAAIVLRTAVVVSTLAFPRPAAAQRFVSPLLGYDFCGDSGCPVIAGCEDKKLNAGIGVGTLGPIVGFELDISYAKNFFGETPRYSSSVSTVVGNVLVGPQIGPVRPYGTGGLGLIKTHIDLIPKLLLQADNNHFGWNVGGGLLIFVAEHVGVRGDVRYFHAFQDLEVLSLPLGARSWTSDERAAAVVFRF